MNCRNASAVLLLIAAVGAGVVVGCSQPATLRPLPEDAVVLAFGDSLTFGVGAEPDTAYPAALARAIDRTVVRSGVPGEVSAAGRDRLGNVLKQHQPALVLICHGGNDVLRRLDEDELATNIRSMVAMSQRAGADVVLIAVPSRSVLLTPLALYRDIGDEYGVPVLEDALSELLRTPALKADPVHLNAAGYAELASRIESLLRGSGAL